MYSRLLDKGVGMGMRWELLRCIAAGILLPFLCLILLASPADARPKTDKVVLANGDVLTGEIKGLQNGYLSYGTDSMGTVSIEWDGVVALDSRFFFRIRTNGGQRYFGALSPSQSPGHVILAHADGQEDLPVRALLSITPIESTLRERLDTVVSAGYSDIKASDSRTTELGLNLSYLGEYSENNLRARLVVSEAGDEINESNRIDLTRRRLWENPQYFNYYGSAWERNDQLGVENRLGVGYGIGRRVLDSARKRLNITGGLQVVAEEDSLGENRESLEGLLVLEYRAWKFSSPEIDLVSNLNLYPGITESGRVRADGNITLSWEITSDLDLQLSAFGSYDNETSNEGDAFDYGITKGIAWEL
ncbi:MAG: DUF481 domain-containing protein [Pseudomonadota bacterium]